MSEEKDALRKTVRAELKALKADAADAADRSRRAACVLTDSAVYKECGAVLAFLSFGTEIQTHNLVRQMLADGKRVAVPRTFENDPQCPDKGTDSDKAPGADKTSYAFKAPGADKATFADKTPCAFKTSGAPASGCLFADKAPVADEARDACKTPGAPASGTVFADKTSGAFKAPGVGDSRMEFYWLSADKPLEEQVEKGDFGILVPCLSLPQVEPAALPEKTLMILPGVAFSKAGWRLGQGRGFYDRYLERMNSECSCNAPDRAQSSITLAGFCYALQLIESVPHDCWDKPVDCIITENGLVIITE